MAAYSAIRSSIQSGDLLVWSRTKLRSLNDLKLKAVQIMTQSSYDHVGIAWNIGNRLMVVEARPPEIRIYPLSRLTPFYYVHMGIKWQDEYTEYLLNHIGDKYSLWEVLTAYFNRNTSDNEWQCAEFVKDFYQHAGLKLDFGYTPKSIVESAIEESEYGIIKAV